MRQKIPVVVELINKADEPLLLRKGDPILLAVVVSLLPQAKLIRCCGSEVFLEHNQSPDNIHVQSPTRSLDKTQSYSDDEYYECSSAEGDEPNGSPPSKIPKKEEEEEDIDSKERDEPESQALF